jgi:uncharacterized SAM-binding protein YcdF (DUF218 family)
MRIGRGFFSKKSIIILLILLGLLMLGRFSLPWLGRVLVAGDEPRKSDLLVVLMGSGPDRILGAVDLYDEGYAESILMVRNNVRGYDIAMEKGADIPHNSEVIKMVAVQLGVLEDEVIILPGDALSTQDEARHVRDYLVEHGDIDSIIIVTSKYHSGRAKKIFEKTFESLNRDLRVLSCPSEYDDFDADEWWKSREDLKRGIQEYMKLTVFCLYEQFKL